MRFECLPTWMKYLNIPTLIRHWSEVNTLLIESPHKEQAFVRNRTHTCRVDQLTIEAIDAHKGEGGIKYDPTRKFFGNKNAIKPKKANPSLFQNPNYRTLPQEKGLKPHEPFPCIFNPCASMI